MTDERSSAEIEREIEEERHALARSLEDLQATLSPERILDQSMGYVRENGGELAENLMRQVKSNPLAAVMASVGIAWLLSSKKEAPVYDRNRHTHDPRFGDGIDRTPNRAAYGGSAYTGTPTYDDRPYAAAPGSLSDPYAGDFDARLEDATSDEPSLWQKAKMAASDFTDEAKAKWLETKVKAGMERDKASAKWDAAKTRAATARYETEAEASARWSSTRDGAASRWGSMRDGTSRQWREWQSQGRASIDDARARYDAGRARAYAKSAELRARLADGTEGMSEQARIRVMRARQAAADAQSDLEYRYGKAKATGERMYDEQPLVGGLVALGAGALVGALLPRTEAEDRYLGSYRDQLFDEADHIFQEESSKLKAVAGAALDEAKSIADEKLDMARGEADKAKSSVPHGKEAVDKVEDEVRSAAQRVADRAKTEAEDQGLGRTAQAEAQAAETKVETEAGRLQS